MELSETEIKEKLVKLLSERNLNYTQLLTLTNELAEHDQENVRFSVDAGLINRLGEELVGKRDTAVSELIKNAYDADSVSVDVIFEDALSKKGKMIIDDDGNGMNREQLINGFMRLSSSDKVHNPESPIYHRIRAGQKGIGRFATQRLGTKLTVITQTQNSDKALKVFIDWNDFAADKNLITIGNEITEIPKVKDKGTLLIIEDLREGWNDAAIKRIYRCVLTLLQPFPLSKVSHPSEDPGFKVNFYRNLKTEENKIVDEVNEISNFALAEINTYIDDEGQGHWRLDSNYFNFHQDFLIGNSTENEKIPFSLVRGVHAKIFYFIYESSLLSGQKLKDIKAIAAEFGGVRLYRRGFRVLPYGEKGDDWLGLDESVRRRTIIAPHQNQSFFGLVEIEGQGIDIFNETSSREGLIENDAYEELVSYLYRVIISAVLKVAELRGRKGSANQKNWEKKNSTIKVDNAINSLKDIIEEYKKGIKHDVTPGTEVFCEKAKTLLDEILIARIDEKQEKEELINELNMMRVLSGTGLIIGEFIHEIKRFLPLFTISIDYIRNHMAKTEEDIEQVNDLELSVRSFSSYTAYFDRSISKNVVRELEPINLREQINSFRSIIKNDLYRAKIDFPDPIYECINLTTVPMHPSEWSSILFNLYTNAKKAIKKTENEDRRICVRCGKESGYLFLEFSDTGIGIKPDDRDNIFNAFFTTSSPVAEDDDNYSDFTGTGLGLKIVRDIISSYGGSIKVVEPYANFKTTFRIEIPKFSKK